MIGSTRAEFRPQPPIDVEGTHNFRSPGGYPAAAGAVIRDGKLFRSDSLERLTLRGRARLAQLGLRGVIDLRDPKEVQDYPSQFHGLPVKIVNNPIFEAGRIPRTTGTITLTDVYLEMVSLHAERLASAVHHIMRSGPDPVLVHCHAGKDRTGLVIALALLAVGVSRDHVLKDYAATEANLTGEWRAARLGKNIPGHPGLDADSLMDGRLHELLFSSPESALSTALDFVDQTYGGVEGLLMEHGFSEDEFKRLATVLTV